MRPLRCNLDPERQRQSAEALADAAIYPAETRAGQEAMMRRPITGETVTHPTYGERQVIADKLENGEGETK